MLKLTLASATVMPVMTEFFSLRPIKPSLAMRSIPTDAFTCTRALDTIEVKLKAPVPLAVAAAACAPATIMSSAGVLQAAVLPLTVSPAIRMLMVACTLPALAVSAPDKAASTAPYFSAALSDCGVKSALADPVVSTVVTTASLPMRSVRPKALATAAFVWVTTSGVMAAVLAPANTAPAFMAARVVSTLRFK